MENLKTLEQLETGRKIILFSSAWCGDCIVLSQYVDLILEKYLN